MTLFNTYMNPNAITSNIENAANKVWHATRPIQWHSENPIRFEKYKIHTKLGENLLTFNYPDDVGPFNYLIAVENPAGFDYGTELLHFNMFDRYIYSKNVQVGEAYQDSGFRIGEILKLTSIMMMVKNNLEKIKLYAPNPFVLFHAKYKFEPDIKTLKESSNALKSVMNSKEANMKPLQEKARELFEAAFKNKPASNKDDNSGLFKETNSLISDFIQQIFKNDRKITPARQPFTEGFDLILTNERVTENKEFFNKLYREHDIDFQI